MVARSAASSMRYTYYGRAAELLRDTLKRATAASPPPAPAGAVLLTSFEQSALLAVDMTGVVWPLVQVRAALRNRERERERRRETQRETQRHREKIVRHREPLSALVAVDVTGVVWPLVPMICVCANVCVCVRVYVCVTFPALAGVGMEPRVRADAGSDGEMGARTVLRSVRAAA
jgi:hypothetical protein